METNDFIEMFTEFVTAVSSVEDRLSDLDGFSDRLSALECYEDQFCELDRYEDRISSLEEDQSNSSAGILDTIEEALCSMPAEENDRCSLGVSFTEAVRKVLADRPAGLLQATPEPSQQKVALDAAHSAVWRAAWATDVFTDPRSDSDDSRTSEIREINIELYALARRLTEVVKNHAETH